MCFTSAVGRVVVEGRVGVKGVVEGGPMGSKLR